MPPPPHATADAADAADDDAPAPPATRLAFGLTLGWFSFAFAELSCGSTPSLFYPAFEFSWSLAITWPLYMSHCVLILTALVRARRALGWATVPPVCLWLGGQLFGLYESWITKVLFRPTFAGFPTCGAATPADGNGTADHPEAMDLHNATVLAAYCAAMENRTDWGPLPGAPMHTLDDPACGIYLGGIAAPQFLTLVFYYHPTWSFIVPCLVCERLLCRTTKDGGYLTVPSAFLPGCLRGFSTFGRRCVKSCQPSCSCGCCCPWVCGITGSLLGLLLLLGAFSHTVVDDYIIVAVLVAILLSGIALGVVSLLTAEEKWPKVLYLFAIYSGFSAMNDNIIQAATTAPMAAAISVWLIRGGRAADDDEGQVGSARRYTLEQLLPRGRELVGWGGILAGIYIFSGLGLSTDCLPSFFGGPAAILLCYGVVFVLLVLHLHRAPDRDDTMPASTPVSGSPATSINTPILQEADAVPPSSALPLSFPEIGWRWERGVAIAGALSAGLTLLSTLCVICHLPLVYQPHCNT